MTNKELFGIITIENLKEENTMTTSTAWNKLPETIRLSVYYLYAETHPDGMDFEEFDEVNARKTLRGVMLDIWKRRSGAFFLLLSLC